MSAEVGLGGTRVMTTIRITAKKPGCFTRNLWNPIRNIFRWFRGGKQLSKPPISNDPPFRGPSSNTELIARESDEASLTLLENTVGRGPGMSYSEVKEWMANQGVIEANIQGHMNVIDFSDPVEAVILKEGDFVYRWESTDPLIQQMREFGVGFPEYFVSDPNISPASVGVNNLAHRVFKKYRVTADTEALKSTTDFTVEKKGGKQLFSPSLHKNIKEVID